MKKEVSIGEIVVALAEELNLVEEHLFNDPDLELVRDFGVDSLSMQSLALELEDQYNITIPDSDLHLCKSVRTITEYINGKLKEAQQ